MLIEKALINAMLFLMVTIGIHYRKILLTVVNITVPKLASFNTIRLRTAS
jgi:hypothetical protein